MYLNDERELSDFRFIFRQIKARFLVFLKWENPIASICKFKLDLLIQIWTFWIKKLKSNFIQLMANKLPSATFS